jgi:hypothetical protein
VIFSWFDLFKVLPAGITDVIQRLLVQEIFIGAVEKRLNKKKKSLGASLTER